jgi:hypothetical protein
MVKLAGPLPVGSQWCGQNCTAFLHIIIVHIKTNLFAEEASLFSNCTRPMNWKLTLCPALVTLFVRGRHIVCRDIPHQSRKDHKDSESSREEHGSAAQWSTVNDDLASTEDRP